MQHVSQAVNGAQTRYITYCVRVCLQGFTWTRIAATVLAGSTSITLQEAVQWQPGSQIVLVTTTWKGRRSLGLVTLMLWLDRIEGSGILAQKQQEQVLKLCMHVMHLSSIQQIVFVTTAWKINGVQLIDSRHTA
jgi:hypothetical protein